MYAAAAYCFDTLGNFASKLVVVWKGGSEREERRLVELVEGQRDAKLECIVCVQ